MGRLLLLIVLSTSLTGSFYLVQMHIGAAEKADRGSERAYDRLAEDVAHSGYAVGAQRLTTSFAPFTETGTGFGTGIYDLVATPDASGALDLRATGHIGSASYAMAGEYVRLGAPCDLLGAVFLNTQLSPAVVLTGTGFQVRGEDTRPPSRTGRGRVIVDGPGYTVAGVLADTLVDESFSIPLANAGTLDASITLGGVSDEGYLRDLVGCTLATAAEALEETTAVVAGSRHYTGRTFGSPLAPTVLVIEDDASFSGTTRGYGILLAGGDVIARGDFIWEGLVMAVGSGISTVALQDSARVYGAVLGGGVPPWLLGSIYGGLSPTGAVGMLVDGTGAVLGPLGLWRRPFGFTMSDEAGVFHSEEALGRLSALLPSLAASERTVVVNERFGMAAGG